jgi:DNA invertase Pin-like site-specific DNA recombinase
MEDAATKIQAAARKRARAKEAFDRTDAELRDLLIEARADGMGPSEMARLTGFTREWVARIAPEPKKTA